MTRNRHDSDPVPDTVPNPQPGQPGGEVQPGCSEPNQVPPSVVGTTHDPKRKKED